MHIYKQLIPPSVVSHSLSGSFTAKDSNDLLIVRGNSLLQLFQTKIVRDEEKSVVESVDPIDENIISGEDSFIGTEIVNVQNGDNKVFEKTKLIFVNEWPLDGFVTDINKVKTIASSDRDCLVICFKYAKLVILHYEDGQFNPISIHFYEKNLPFGTAPGLRSGFDRLDNELNQKKGFVSQTARAANSIIDSTTSVIPEYQAYHFVDPNFPSKFIIDPFSSCLCLLYQKDQFAFLPFTKEEDVEDGGSSLSPIHFSSFLCHSSRLDENISNIINFTFLHEYREPTMAIIFEPVETWAPTQQLNKDTVQYLVLSLDLQNHSSTAIISIDNLPYDIDQIIPLPAPVGGSLLIGATHLIHIDSTGKLTGLVVNEYSKLVTKMSNTFIDQSVELGNLKLEDSIAMVVENSTDVLLILKNAKKYTLKFSIESRKVQGMKLREVVQSEDAELTGMTPTTASSIGSNHIFVASSIGDCNLINWQYEDEDERFEIVVKTTVVKPKATEVDDYDDLYADEEEEEEEEKEETEKDAEEAKGDNEPQNKDVVETKPDDVYDDEYDDIYGSGAAASAQKKKAALSLLSSRTNTLARIKVSLDDTLPCYPINDIAIGRPFSSDKYIKFSEPTDYLYDLVASTGAGVKGGISVYQKTIRPIIISDLELGEERINLTGLWTLAPRSKVVAEDVTVFDSYLLATSDGSSILYRIGEEITDITAETELLLTHTVKAGTLLSNSVITQVHENGVLFYDSEFNRLGNFNNDGNDGIIIKASISDPYILLYTSIGSVIVLKLTDKGNSSSTSDSLSIEKVDFSPELSSLKVKSGFISTLEDDFNFEATGRKKRKRDDDIGGDTRSDKLVTLVDNNSIILYQLGKGFLRYSSFSKLDDVVEPDKADSQPDTTNSQSTIIQAIIAPLGDNIVKDNYLFILTSSGELIIYKPITTNSILTFVKTQCLGSPLDVDDIINVTLDPIEDFGISGLSAVVVTGDNPLVVTKGYQSPVRIHPFIGSPSWGFASFNTDSVSNGFAYLDDRNVLRISSLDDKIDYQQPWPVKRMLLNESVTGICYHSTAKVYVVAVCKPIVYNAVDGDEVPIPGLLEGMEKAKSFQSGIKLISPLTWTVIDEVTLEENEVIMDIKSVKLEVSERQRLKKEYISFGTSFLRGEDLAAKGCFYVYDCIEIVPEPGKPETNRKFKEVGNESIKGAVTAICEVNGYLLVSQGQKVVIRNIQEDKSIIPVAFLDLGIYVSTVSKVKNLLLLGDGMRNTIIAGFGEEPYRMSVISKDFRELEVTSSEFIYNNGSLYAVVSDRDRRLHLLQYDPEDLSSLSGQKLIRRSEFFTGKNFSSMLSVPINDNTKEDNIALMPLCAADDGSLVTIVPVSENTYRALYVIQQQIIDKDDHNACLNPRMHRAHGSELPTSRQFSSSSKGLLDYDVISRYAKLPVDKRQLYARKVGKNGLQEVLNNIRVVEDSLNYI